MCAELNEAGNFREAAVAAVLVENRYVRLDAAFVDQPGEFLGRAFNLEEELKARGARYTKAMLPLGKHVLEDGLLITGQNPASARGVGEAVARALRATAPQAREKLEAV